MTRALSIVLLALASSSAVRAEDDGSCLHIQSVTAFAPRGEVYVEVGADCSESDFAGDDVLIAYLEVLVGDQTSVGEDVRIYPEAPRRRQTFEFGGFRLEPTQPILVRLVRFGEIMALRGATVP